MSKYNKLYTPEDSAVVFIDHQPQMTFGVSSIDRALLINNVTLLAKVAKEFGVPAVLTAVETESFSGYVWPQILDIFPGQPVIERTSMNSWRVTVRASDTYESRPGPSRNPPEGGAHSRTRNLRGGISAVSTSLGSLTRGRPMPRNSPGRLSWPRRSWMNSKPHSPSLRTSPKI